MTCRGRFAPSPTGELHFGSLVAVFGSWLFARAVGGRWIVRMEDLDGRREVAGAADEILATLHSFGFISDEPVLRQSERTAIYRAALEQLRAHDRVYPCWCSRADLQPFAGIHPARCVSTPSPRRAPAWRVRAAGRTIAFDDAIQGAQTQDVLQAVGDFVVWRADDVCAYQLAVVVDDAEQGIDSVVRGADLLDSTPRQILLQRWLGVPTPRYAHLPLVLDTDGRKLGKRMRALPVDRSDPLPALRAALAFLGQGVPDAMDVTVFLQSAAAQFNAARIPKSAAVPIPIAAAQKDVCDDGGHN